MQRAEYTWEGDAVAKKLRGAGIIGLRKWLELVLTDSRAIVPLEEGTLERSGVTSVDERTLSGAVSYDTEYAVPQHENLEYVHAPGREAKYLEKPWLQRRKLALVMIQKEMRKVTKS